MYRTAPGTTTRYLSPWLTTKSLVAQVYDLAVSSGVALTDTVATSAPPPPAPRRHSTCRPAIWVDARPAASPSAYRRAKARTSDPGSLKVQRTFRNGRISN